MKKIGILVLLLSSLSFADYQKISARYNQLETEYNQLMNLEEKEYAKLETSAKNAAKQLEERKQLKASLEDKISKIEDSSGAKYFKSEYGAVLKEYKNVVKALDTEIKSLSTTVENYEAIKALKGGY